MFLVNQGIFEKIVEVLNDAKEDTDIVYQTLVLLSHILRFTRGAELKDNYLAVKFQNLDGVDPIEDLMNHPREILSRISKEFLEEFYGIEEVDLHLSEIHQNCQKQYQNNSKFYPSSSSSVWKNQSTKNPFQQVHKKTTDNLMSF